MDKLLSDILYDLMIPCYDENDQVKDNASITISYSGLLLMRDRAVELEERTPIAKEGEAIEELKSKIKDLQVLCGLSEKHYTIIQINEIIAKLTAPCNSGGRMANKKLHRHPEMESRKHIDDYHVIVDKKDREDIIKLLTDIRDWLSGGTKDIFVKYFRKRIEEVLK